MTILSVILQIILGIMFAFLGLSALIGADKAKENFQHLKLPNWFRFVTGFVQLIGAICMIVGIWAHKLALFGGIWLTITLIVGGLLHLRIKEPLSSAIPAFAIAILSFIIFLLRL